MRTPHLHVWRRGVYRYSRNIPADAVAACGRAKWSKNLGRISLADAQAMAAALDAQADEELRRVRALAPADLAALIAEGGIATLELRLEELEEIARAEEAIAAKLRKHNGSADRTQAEALTMAAHAAVEAAIAAKIRRLKALRGR